jgi:transcriptional regulator with XRE-family HTH domain
MLKRMRTGDRIKTLRKAKGWSQHEMADRVFMDPSTYCRLENSERQPSTAVLQRVAQELGTTINYLLGEEDMPAPAGGESALHHLRETNVQLKEQLDENRGMIQFLRGVIERLLSPGGGRVECSVF